LWRDYNIISSKTEEKQTNDISIYFELDNLAKKDRKREREREREREKEKN